LSIFRWTLNFSNLTKSVKSMTIKPFSNGQLASPMCVDRSASPIIVDRLMNNPLCLLNVRRRYRLVKITTLSRHPRKKNIKIRIIYDDMIQFILIVEIFCWILNPYVVVTGFLLRARSLNNDRYLPFFQINNYFSSGFE